MWHWFFLDLSQGGECNYARILGLTRQGIPTKLPLNLLTGKVSHWKAKKKNSTIKPDIKFHNWPKRRQSLQLQGKEKCNLRYDYIPMAFSPLGVSSDMAHNLSRFHYLEDKTKQSLKDEKKMQSKLSISILFGIIEIYLTPVD